MIQRAAQPMQRADATVDLQVLGQRHNDVRNGLTVPPGSSQQPIDIVTKPAWAFSILMGHATLASLRPRETWRTSTRWPHGPRASSIPTLSWKDVEWVKSLWPGKLILKGILDVDDAKIAVTTGADAISVSNHGGRQLDGAPSAIFALPRVVDAVGSEIEVMFDSGVRTGADMMRALALGARSCIVGRSYIYGLGAGGQAGVARAIEILRQGVRRHHGAVRRQNSPTSTATCSPTRNRNGAPHGDFPDPIIRSRSSRRPSTCA